MKSGYETLTWIDDASGKEYVCALENIGNKKSFDDLTDEEQSHCADIDEIVGAERWQHTDTARNTRELFSKKGYKMNLKDYFSQTTGLGVLSTADSDGKVNSAIYASPHFLEDNRVSFIMRDRLTRANLTSNPNANYMFIEESGGLKGIRVNLHKASESGNQEQISKLSRKKTAGDSEEQRYLVTFSVEKILALIGGHEYPIDAFPGVQAEKVA